MSYTLQILARYKATGDARRVGGTEFYTAMLNAHAHPETPFNVLYRNSFSCREIMMGDYNHVADGLAILQQRHSDVNIEYDLIGGCYPSKAVMQNIVDFLNRYFVGYGFSGYIGKAKFSANADGTLHITVPAMNAPSGTLLSILMLLVSSSNLHTSVFSEPVSEDLEVYRAIINCHYYSINYQEHILTAFYLYNLKNCGYLSSITYGQNEAGNGPAKASYYHVMYNPAQFFNFLKVVRGSINMNEIPGLYTGFSRSQPYNSPLTWTIRSFVESIDKLYPEAKEAPIKREDPVVEKATSTTSAYQPASSGDIPVAAAATVVRRTATVTRSRY